MTRRRRILLIGGLVVLLVGGWWILDRVQQHLVYGGKPYPANALDDLPAGFEPLRYRTSQGAQVSFYLPPTSGREPQRLWLVCNGNACHALEWPDLRPEVGDPEAGFLLLDYPGSGLCAGSSTPGRILEASEAALEALRSRLSMAPEPFTARVGVFGYSLGTGTAMQYAARHQVRRIVLAAPYTSLAEMADLTYAWPCGSLLWHRFDNQARLAEVAGQQPRPTVLIVHGDRDACIPVGMSRRLAAPYAGWVDLRVIPGSDHDDIADKALSLLAP